MGDTPLIVWTTLPEEALAHTIAQTLVKEALAACVQVVPGIRSFYLWQGVMEQSGEVMLAIKTRQACYAALQSRLVALHPYQVPEILATPVSEGLPAYLQWLLQATPSPQLQE